MESWTPLFDIFLNSPCPESEASLWLTKSFNPSSSSNTTSISTSSFLSLLTKKNDTPLVHSSCSSSPSVMWIQTLPDLVQARILSFLAYDHQRFCKMELCKLAGIVLSEGKGVDFWVRRGAQQLLDLVSLSNYQWLSHLNLDSEEENVGDEFDSLPDWLRDGAKDCEPLFSWLPLSHEELSQGMPFSVCGGHDGDSMIDVEGREKDDFDEVMEEVDVDELKFDDRMDADIESRARTLKEKLLNSNDPAEPLGLATEIRELCVRNRVNALAILHLVEPWNVDDEMSAVLISQLCDGSEGDELGWPSHVLCSVILPNLITLNEPPSRLLMSATIEFCKSHQITAEYALLFPLIHRTEGINNPICDVVTKIVKECLHPAHVSAFCHKLLCKDEDTQKFICLPCHRCLISDEVVWTESLFGFLQNILNHNVHLSQDSVDQLVHVVLKSADRYSKSLKFGNFLLCLVNKCAPYLKPHKLLLTVAVESTNTLVTKSILSKLSAL